MKKATGISRATIGLVVVLSAVIIGAAAMIVTYKVPRARPFMYSEEVMPTSPRAAFLFKPKADITPYELAIAMISIVGSNGATENLRQLYDQMPPEVKRHWVELRSKQETPTAPPPRPAVPYQDAPKF